MPNRKVGEGEEERRETGREEERRVMERGDTQDGKGCVEKE